MGNRTRDLSSKPGDVPRLQGEPNRKIPKWPPINSQYPTGRPYKSGVKGKDEA